MKKKLKYEGEIKLERIIPYDWSKKQIHEVPNGLCTTETVSLEELKKQYPSMPTGSKPESKE